MPIDKYRNEAAGGDAYQLEDGTGVLLLESSSTTQDAAFAGDFGSIDAPIVIQYQAIVGPVVRAAVAVFDPSTSYVDVEYPAFIKRFTFPVAQQYVLPTVPLSDGSNYAWRSVAPVSLDRITYRTANQPYLAWGLNRPTGLVGIEVPTFPPVNQPVRPKPPITHFTNPFKFEYPAVALSSLDWCPVLITIDAPKDSMIPSGMDPSKIL